MTSTRGMEPVEGSDPTAGNRDFEITLERDGFEDVSIAELFDGNAQTFDPTVAVEFTTVDLPNKIERFRVGDVLTMRVVINT